jgi:hypothetical protein
MKALKFSLLLICAVNVVFAADHNWLTGKVLDANAKRDIVQTGSTFHANTFGTGTATTSGSRYNNNYNAITQASGQSATTGYSRVQHEVFQENQIVIQGVQYLYTVDDLTKKATDFLQQGALARAIANRKHGCRMIIGDPVLYEQAKDKLFVQDADGKVCKMDIVRQERIPNI